MISDVQILSFKFPWNGLWSANCGQTGAKHSLQEDGGQLEVESQHRTAYLLCAQSTFCAYFSNKATLLEKPAWTSLAGDQQDQHILCFGASGHQQLHQHLHLQDYAGRPP